MPRIRGTNIETLHPTEARVWNVFVVPTIMTLGDSSFHITFHNPHTVFTPLYFFFHFSPLSFREYPPFSFLFCLHGNSFTYFPQVTAVIFSEFYRATLPAGK
jgi:hypothetical protein